ncbi:hypothetical protein ACT29H_03160 [Thermophagus sp. OGC60D27]|uniref:hypothetical protein n=1 Tax=Thermophagus sp. OGC60D27 TaxID=3458415 RepID=UPI0040377A1F
MKRLVFFAFVFFSIQVKAQVKADGYIGMMPSVYYLDQQDLKMWENVLHNRLNLSYDFSPSVLGVLQFRNRYISGETVNKISGYPGLIEKDPGFLDMSFNLASGTSSVMNITVDRLWLDFYVGKLQIRAGRQRINWGQAMVWNPNDIFNAYSYFDFDYPERPGIDGVRLQLYTGVASQVEGVVKINRVRQKTWAARYRFNAGSYDWQFLGGRLNDQEWVAGMGWSGQIGDAAFYGENTLLFPNGDNATYIASAGMNYTFKNSLLLQIEGLYSSNLSDEGENFIQFVGSRASLFSDQSSVRELSFSKYSVFASAQYPFTPLFTGSFSVMAFPPSTAFYLGPTLEYSLKPNLYLSTFFNLFLAQQDNRTKIVALQGALRLKWFF